MDEELRVTLRIQKDKLVKYLEEQFSYNTRMWVSIGYGKDKLHVYIQDDYLTPFDIKKVKTRLEEFEKKEAIPLKVRNVGKMTLLSEGQTE